MIISSFIILVHSCTHTYIYISLFLLPYYLYHSALQNMMPKKTTTCFCFEKRDVFFFGRGPKFRWVSLLQNGKPCWLNPIGCWSIGGSLPSREPWVSLKPWVSGLGLDDGAVTKTPGHYLIGQINKAGCPNLLLGNSTISQNVGGKPWRIILSIYFFQWNFQDFQRLQREFFKFDLYGTGYFVKKKDGMHRYKFPKLIFQVESTTSISNYPPEV